MIISPKLNFFRTFFTINSFRHGYPPFQSIPFSCFFFKKLNFVSDRTIAPRISAPMIIFAVNTSLKMITENAMPQNDSVDKMMAAFVSVMNFCATVCNKYAIVVEKMPNKAVGANLLFPM